MSTVDLGRFEQRSYSQGGEDGVIAEILRRIGAPTRSFVEFGTGDGHECNCATLAEDGWSGLFMEADAYLYARLEDRWRDRPDIRTVKAVVGPHNVEQLFAAGGVPTEPDVLSIDVDSSDWHIWQAITAYRPRLVVIEYNGCLPLGRRLVQPLQFTGPWDHTDYYGASLGAMEQLGTSKGYELVHTEGRGVDAFFVRADLIPGSGLPTGPAVARHVISHFGPGVGHPRDPHDRPWWDLETGKFVRLGRPPEWRTGVVDRLRSRAAAAGRTLERRLRGR